jgi:hypothetical protein
VEYSGIKDPPASMMIDPKNVDIRKRLTLLKPLAAVNITSLRADSIRRLWNRYYYLIEVLSLCQTINPVKNSVETDRSDSLFYRSSNLPPFGKIKNKLHKIYVIHFRIHPSERSVVLLTC